MGGRQFVYILIFTLITIIIWIGADFIHSQAKKVSPPAEVSQLIEPLDPNFDQEAINELGI